MSYPTRQTPPPPERGPSGPRLLAAVMTILALAPLGAVGGALLAYKFGKDMATFALGGAVIGAFVALITRSR